MFWWNCVIQTFNCKPFGGGKIWRAPPIKTLAWNGETISSVVVFGKWFSYFLSGNGCERTVWSRRRYIIRLDIKWSCRETHLINQSQSLLQTDIGDRVFRFSCPPSPIKSCSLNEVGTSLSRHYFQFTFRGDLTLGRSTPPLLAPHQKELLSCANPFFRAGVLRFRGSLAHHGVAEDRREGRIFRSEIITTRSGRWGGELVRWRSLAKRGRWGKRADDWTAELEDRRFAA